MPWPEINLYYPIDKVNLLRHTSFAMENKPVTIKSFPTELFRKFKAEAALRGVSVSDLFVEAVRKMLKKG